MILRARVLLAGCAATVAVVGLGADALVARRDSDRTLSFYNIHTKERITVTYMRDGRRDPEAMKKINWMMRDWRRDEATDMDPELIDLVWEVHTELGSKEPIHVISGYRSPGTNEKLRKGGGGQAKNSRHIMGKAADIHFPDVPLKQLRYSGLVREKGGVGYYPTSGVPFVHLDTGRVRHWPRMPRYELALLFPNGQSQHTPADGRPLSRSDYVVAKSRFKDLAQQVAAFFDLRNGVKQPTLVADAGDAARGSAPSAAPLPQLRATIAPEPKAAPRSASQERRVASLGPAAAALAPEPPPQLVSAPQLASPPRPAARAPAPRPEPAKAVSREDRNRLASLFRLASFAPAPNLLLPPAPAVRDSADKPEPNAAASLTGGAMPAPVLPKTAAKPQSAETTVAALAPDTAGDLSAPRSITDIERAGFSTGWAAAPEFDEEHPDEMSYRPFPVAPLLTETASADDPVLTRVEHPDVAQTLEMLGQERDQLPLKLRPGQQVVALMLAQQFKGSAVDLSELGVSGAHTGAGNGLARRSVRTSSR